jgi:protein-S-isoprenylcysteine O-methyltransferase Ste14
MDTLRYLMALMLVTLVPAVLLYWLLLHALLPVWRRAGVAAAQYALWAAVLVAAGFLFVWRDLWLAVDFGFQPLVVTAGIIFLSGAIVFRLHVARFLPWSVQLGLPEIDVHGHPQHLITEGSYAHTRHPRYLQIALALAGWALLANYPAGYVAALLWLPLMLVIVRLEEAELHRRFGGEYHDYCEQVARFWPHSPPLEPGVKAGAHPLRGGRL